jgi:uncharacterized protein
MVVAPPSFSCRPAYPGFKAPRAVHWIVRSALCLCVVALTANGGLRGQSVGSTQEYSPGTWVIDNAGAIPEYARVQLQNLGDAIVKYKNAEMVLLTAQNVGDDPRRYAIDWFNRNKIGDARNNNGVLVLCSFENRAIEIVLGDGLNTPENNRRVQEIIDDQVIPRMRRNDPAGALFQAAFLTARDVVGYREIGENIPRSRAELETAQQRLVRAGRNDEWKYAYLAAALAGLAGFFSIAFGIARWRVRYGARQCAQCQQPMQMLDEQHDNSFLEPPEIIEEDLGSVDYDVWACFNCREVIKYRYGTLFTRYSRCPKCSYRTKSKLSRTLRAATTERGGLVRVDEDCEHCDYHDTFTYATARLPKPSSSGGGGKGWSGGFGGGFGGGFSGGGGGGGRSGGFSSGGGGSGRW